MVGSKLTSRALLGEGDDGRLLFPFYLAFFSPGTASIPHTHNLLWFGGGPYISILLPYTLFDFVRPIPFSLFSLINHHAFGYGYVWASTIKKQSRFLVVELFSLVWKNISWPWFNHSTTYYNLNPMGLHTLACIQSSYIRSGAGIIYWGFAFPVNEYIRCQAFAPLR